MALTMEEAKKLGREKLNVTDQRWSFGVEKAREIGVRPGDMGAMVLALALLGGHKVSDTSDKVVAAELTDALALVAKAEKEWRLEQGGYRL